MKPKIAKIVELLDALEEDVPEDKLYVTKSSRLEITTDDGTVEFDHTECERLLGSPDAVEKLHEALGSPEHAELTLHDVEPASDVHDKLEELFDVVD